MNDAIEIGVAVAEEAVIILKERRDADPEGMHPIYNRTVVMKVVESLKF
jgi:hypothetical protein